MDRQPVSGRDLISVSRIERIVFQRVLAQEESQKDFGFSQIENGFKRLKRVIGDPPYKYTSPADPEVRDILFQLSGDITHWLMKEGDIL